MRRPAKECTGPIQNKGFGDRSQGGSVRKQSDGLKQVEVCTQGGMALIGACKSRRRTAQWEQPLAQALWAGTTTGQQVP